MRISRLYLPQPLQSGLHLELDEDSGHYVRSVLRLKKEARLALFNGHGGEWQARTVEVSRRRVAVEVGQWREMDVESPLQTWLALAISRSDRMDLSVQKAVELGVNGITPLFTERCMVKLTAEKTEQKIQHWQNIARHAAEQCGRTVAPEVRRPVQIHDWLVTAEGLKIFLDPAAHSTMTGLQPGQGRVTLLSGPEGGFADHERDAAGHAGFIPVRLGRRILRAETAALAALASVQMLWGDFAGDNGS